MSDFSKRKLLRVSGKHRAEFLQGLVTNDVKKLKDGLVYAALLTPQGKYLADFLLVPHSDAILIDVAEPQAAGLLQRLTMYKLRADVAIEATDLIVSRGVSQMPDGAFADPRADGLGWRAYGNDDVSEQVDWLALYVSLGIPQAGQELGPDSFILEMDFERLNGVDFKKGCYVGQEVTARMKHKTELRKGLATVMVDGNSQVGAEITADGKPAGTLHTIAGNQALAYLRFDRAKGQMQAGDAKITRI